MPGKQSLAIVLKAFPYEERHKIITALTLNYGKTTVLARNCIQSKRFGDALDPFVASDWEYTEKPGQDMGRLHSVELRYGFRGLSQELHLLSLASFFNEVLLQVTQPSQNCSQIFQVHTNALGFLEQNPLEPKLIYLKILNSYLSKVLLWLGHQPQIHQCRFCSKNLRDVLDEEICLFISDANWSCLECREFDLTPNRRFWFPISSQVLIEYWIATQNPIRQATQNMWGEQEIQEKLFEILEALLTYHHPSFALSKMKSSRFLQKYFGLRELESPSDPQILTNK